MGFLYLSRYLVDVSVENCKSVDDFLSALETVDEENLGDIKSAQKF